MFKSVLFGKIGSLGLLSLAVIATTTIAIGNSGSTSQAWADVIEGTEGPDQIVGTPEDDIIDSKGGNDRNFGDAVIGDGSGNDLIDSGEGQDLNTGDTLFGGTGSGNDIIVSGEEDDANTGNGGGDIFVCGEGEDTVTDYNEAEGDIATPDCENV